MSSRTKRSKEGTALVPNAGYEVGHGKPPEHTRFKPGQSGNPRGRPKGAKNKLPGLHEERMKDVILEEAYRTVPIRDGDRSISIPMVQAVMRSISVNAAKGNVRAQRLFAQLLADTESSRKLLANEWLDTAITYKVEWEKELDRRSRLGITDLPPPLPHPDHVVINFNEGTARIVGPATKEEQAELEEWYARRDDFQAELDELEEMREETDDEAGLALIDDDIAMTRRVLEIIDGKMPRKAP